MQILQNNLTRRLTINNQEKRLLLNIGDPFKKVIIVKDNIKPKKDENGILRIGLKDFLLNDESIDL